ncbi:MAG: hypothetical protein ABIR63_05230 [Sphingomicrobium sp.]
MVRLRTLMLTVSAIAAVSCNQSQPSAPQPKIEVRGAEQNGLHTLDAFNLSIALKRAIFDLGYKCQRVERAGFVSKYQNLDMWTAHCNDGRDWAIFAGPDGSAQVRDCKDFVGSDVPACAIREVPKGSFDKAG